MEGEFHMLINALLIKQQVDQEEITEPDMMFLQFADHYSCGSLSLATFLVEEITQAIRENN